MNNDFYGRFENIGATRQDTLGAVVSRTEAEAVQTQRDADSPPKMSFLVGFGAFLLGIYNLAVACIAVAVISEVYFDDLATIANLELPLPRDPSLLMDLKVALLTGFGASLGACLLGFLGLFQHAVLAPEFNARFFGSYVIGPWAAIFLGLSSYVLVRAGLLAFGGIDDVTRLSSTNRLSYLALGILVGFAWNRVLSKLSDIAAQMFSSGSQRPAIGTHAPNAQDEKPSSREQ